MSLSLSRCLGVAVVVAMTSVACGAGDGAPESQDESSFPLDPQLEYVKYFGDPRQPNTSLENYVVSQERWIDRTISACMAEGGFEYEARSDSDIRNGLALVITDDSIEDRQTRGYGISIQPENADVPEESAPNQAVPGGPGYNEALSGPEGCRSSATEMQSMIAETVEAYLPEFGSVWERYLSDEDVRGAEDEWRDCMAGQGYDAESTFDLQEQISGAVGLVTDELSLTEVQEFERRAAVADFECSERLVSVSGSVLESLMEDFEDEFGIQIISDLEDIRTN